NFHVESALCVHGNLNAPAPLPIWPQRAGQFLSLQRMKTMSKLRFHKLAAIAVLIGFGAWVGTGEFSSVGSASPDSQATENQPKAEQAKADDVAPARVVKVVKPPRDEHARAIRISGLTEADKRAVLATRVAGIIDKLPVKQGDHVKTGDLILMLAAEEKI